MVELLASPQQRAFGDAKRDTLPQYCLDCDVRFACNGECPKNRFTLTPDGEPGLNYLCSGYKAFFGHIDGPMRMMSDLLRQGRYADEVMGVLARGWSQRPVPVRERPQGQDLPPALTSSALSSGPAPGSQSVSTMAIKRRSRSALRCCPPTQSAPWEA